MDREQGMGQEDWCEEADRHGLGAGKGDEEHPRRGRREKVFVGPKEQRKWQEEYMEGTGGFRGCVGIWAMPRHGPALPDSAPWGPPCPSRGKMGPQAPALHRRCWPQSSSVWVPGLAPAVFCAWLDGAGGCVWGVELDLGAETTNGDTHMESPSCRSTPGEGKQNKTSTILRVSDDLICGWSFW